MTATRMHNPPHPGEILQDTVLADGRLSVSAPKLGSSDEGGSERAGKRGPGFRNVLSTLVGQGIEHRNRGSVVLQPAVMRHIPFTPLSQGAS